MKRRLILCLVAVAAFALVCSASYADSYAPGYTWVRTDTYDNTPHVNPQLDTVGNPVWSYDSVPFGNGITDPNPWYKQSGTPLQWIVGWGGSAGENGWAGGQTSGPAIGHVHLFQSLVTSYGSNLPVLTWTDPVSGTTSLDISGFLQVDWIALAGPAPTCPVDVILTQYSFSGNTYSDIVHTTVNNGGSNTYQIPISTTISVNAGDELILSMRGNGALGPYPDGIQMDEGNLVYQITPVPEPGSFVALLAGIGGLGGMMLRRRK